MMKLSCHYFPWCCLLYCRFCKNAIFQNLGNIMFFCRFAFFSPANFSQPPLNRFAPNLERMCPTTRGRKWRLRFLKSSKTRLQRPKTSKNRSIFHTRSHAFVLCNETVKDFWKMLPHGSMEQRKDYTLTAIISKTVWDKVNVCTKCQ